MSARDQMIAAIVTVLAVFAAAWGAYWLLRRCKYAAWLMEEVPGPVREQPRTEPYSLGDHVIPIDPDPALGCRFCGPPFDPCAICGCAGACKDPNCGWLAWQAAANTEEWER